MENINTSLDKTKAYSRKNMAGPGMVSAGSGLKVTQVLRISVATALEILAGSHFFPHGFMKLFHEVVS